MKKIVSIIIGLSVSSIITSGIVTLDLAQKFNEKEYNESVKTIKYIPQIMALESPNLQENLEKEVEEDDTIKETVTISAAGDCTLGYYKGQSEWNRFDQVANKHGMAYFMKNVQPIFSKDDLTIINLEGPLTKASYNTEKQFMMRGDPKYIEIIKSGDIEAANLANNHTYDCGKQGYEDTVKLLEKNEIGAFGNKKIHYQTINGIDIGLIGYKAWDSSKATKNILKELIIQAKEKSDLVIIMFHWGEESKYEPNQVQKDLARFVIDCGVDLVLGSHPHVIQGIETYKGKNIVYSMGNFSFGGNRNPKDKDTFIYQETFELQGDKIVSTGSKIIPCSISSVTDRNNYQPTIAKDEKRILDKLKKYSNQFKQSYFKTNK